MCWIAGQNPQRVVAPIEEEEEDVLDECIYFMLVMEHIGTNKVKCFILFLLLCIRM